ncbi:MAG: undecaprenyl-diphosphate phosphatase [Acidimicrobiia bacterium]
MLSTIRILIVLLVAATASSAAADELTPVKAAVLGVIEGITEYLPISSTGHLLVAQELLDVGATDETEDAADTYAITIQAGAILAVVVLYFARLRAMAAGLVGRDTDGRRVLLAVVIAFVPAAVVGVVFEAFIKDALFGVGPIIAAWIVGGVAILVLAPRLRQLGERGHALELLTPRAALVIGAAQVIALWPGTSRSLVTIVAALFVGLSMGAALEFSFLLGLATLTAATLYELARNGGDLFETFGVVNPLIGFVVAFASAVLAVRWLVGYLDRHGLELFGWYRIGVAVIALGLVVGGVL